MNDPDPPEEREPADPAATSDAADGVIRLPIEDALDLHAISPRDVRDAVEGYLEACHERGFREVRIIHGRGTGTQREIVRSLLAQSPYVEAFADAGAERGGWGATIVTLAPPVKPPAIKPPAIKPPPVKPAPGGIA
jgi:DNA-nicking Smr family endonuclease